MNVPVNISRDLWIEVTTTLWEGLQHAACNGHVGRTTTYQCGVILAALLVIGSSVAARRAAYLLNYEELLPLAQGPFISWSWAIAFERPQQEMMRGLCIKPCVGLLNHISALGRLVVFARIDNTAQSDVVCTHLQLAVRVGLEAYSGVELPQWLLTRWSLTRNASLLFSPPRCCLIRLHCALCGDCWAYIASPHDGDLLPSWRLASY
ncbi:hypothetical protein GGI43DRAFT_165102 [Trichoderma evansii]